MLVFCALINVASCKLLSALCCAWNHTLNSKLHSKITFFIHKCAVFNFLKVTDITCVMLIKLLVELITCKNSFICVDNNNEIAAIYIWSKDWLVLAAKKNCCFCCNSSERFALSVNNIPLAFNFVSILFSSVNSELHF